MKQKGCILPLEITDLLSIDNVAYGIKAKTTVTEGYTIEFCF